MSPDIFVTTVDAAHLWRVLEVFRDPSYTPLTEFLLGELQRAVLVEPRAVSQTIVTMNSRVRFRLDGAGEAREATLVCPGREDSLLAEFPCSRLSVARLSECVRAKRSPGTGPMSAEGALTVLKVLYQPEAHGIDLGDEGPSVGKCGCKSRKLCYI